MLIQVSKLRIFIEWNDWLSKLSQDLFQEVGDFIWFVRKLLQDWKVTQLHMNTQLFYLGAVTINTEDALTLKMLLVHEKELC